MAGKTKLDAINIMLSAIGDSPVSSLSSGLVEAEQAEQVLDNLEREVQSIGWHFNTDNNKLFAQTVGGEIILPLDCLRADATLLPNSPNLVQRGGKMYDRTNHTFIIGKEVYLDIVLHLEFEDLPEIAKRYITLKGARIFQDRFLGSETIHKFQLRDEADAYQELKEFEQITEDSNIFDNYDTFSILDR